MVEGVVTVKAKDGNRYNGIPVLITDPSDLDDTIGSLHCSIPNIPRFVKEYLGGALNQTLAVVGKPCDIRAIIELQKRHQIGRENLILIGLNCTGTISPAVARKMFVEEFKVDPDRVVSEDIDDGKLTIHLDDGKTKSKDLSKLEKKGLGRRENCRRCVTNIPTYADIACGKWGTENEKENSSFIEVVSGKGRKLIEGAVENGYIKVSKPTKESIQVRIEKDEAERELAKVWRDKAFKPLLDLENHERLEYWMDEFSKCIKCYGCRDACPICYCDHCLLEANRGFIDVGRIPPEPAYPLTRIAHVSDSCVNCGQCQDACPMDLPLSKLFAFMNERLSEVFDYDAGMDIEEMPPMNAALPEELQIDDTFLDMHALHKSTEHGKDS
jgi:formate dehydrogenase subunit beta